MKRKGVLYLFQLLRKAFQFIKVKEKRFMFGENYLLIENTDSRGRRVEQWVAENADGENVHLDDPALMELADGCNTDKDKYTRRTKIAGVNVVSYPCGIILSIEELYGSESLSQVLLPIYGLMSLPAIRQDVKGNKIGLMRHPVLTKKNKQIKG